MHNVQLLSLFVSVATVDSDRRVQVLRREARFITVSALHDQQLFPGLLNQALAHLDLSWKLRLVQNLGYGYFSLLLRHV